MTSNMISFHKLDRLRSAWLAQSTPHADCGIYHLAKIVARADLQHVRAHGFQAAFVAYYTRFKSLFNDPKILL